MNTPQTMAKWALVWLLGGVAAAAMAGPDARPKRTDVEEVARRNAQAEAFLAERGATVTDYVVDFPRRGIDALLTIDGQWHFHDRRQGLLFTGEVIDAEDGSSYSDRLRRELARRETAQLGAQHWIEYRAEPERAVLYAWVDPLCGFCRSFHGEIAKLNAGGVTVRYLPLPVLSSPSVVASIWCTGEGGEGRRRLYEEALVEGVKSREAIVCLTMEQGVRVGRRLGARGTPHIVASDGRVLGGYLSAERALAALGLAPVGEKAETGGAGR